MSKNVIFMGDKAVLVFADPWDNIPSPLACYVCGYLITPVDNYRFLKSDNRVIAIFHTTCEDELKRNITVLPTRDDGEWRQ